MWLFKHTKDEARDVVVSKGKDNIQEIMGGIQTLHGALEDAVVPDVEEALSKVKYWVTKNGNYETFNKEKGCIGQNPRRCKHGEILQRD
jgi:hypothetical protein